MSVVEPRERDSATGTAAKVGADGYFHEDLGRDGTVAYSGGLQISVKDIERLMPRTCWE